MRLPFYLYKYPSGAREAVFVDSNALNITLHDVWLTIGYSRLDYATKYETAVFDWYLDGDVGIGISGAKFHETAAFTDNTETDPTQIDKDGTSVFLLPFNVELGLLLYKRYYAARGLGWYIRLGYRTEGNWTGFSGKPTEKKSAASEDEYDLRYNRFELRHGPYLNIGAVY